MRTLTYIPIVHSAADMGSEAERIRDAYVERHGKEAWEESREAIASAWEQIEKDILGLDLDFRKVRLYQDGLPVCGREQEIVREIARRGSPNYRLLLDLIAKGATLEGTEDPQLLLEEYRVLKTTAAALGQAEEREAAIRDYEEESRRLLEQRDRFIGRRIAETLKEGETGLLFIGALHRVDQTLPKDIAVRPLAEHLARG
ncbi:MAG: hypothetical protein ACE5NC_05360 [Anaerolineae bacterium]